MLKLTNFERETIINFSEAEAIADIETYNVKLKNRLEVLACQYPLSVKMIDSDSSGCVRYQVDKNLVAIRKPYSELRRQADKTRDLASRFHSSDTDKLGRSIT